jgi:hypothetical protein
MAGFFDRMKERFTQYAAGTTDLSNLSEEQQKLLRRQAIGRLGASLYQTGDFGAAMQQQEAMNLKQQEAAQAEAARRRAQEIWGGSPLTPQQQTLASPVGVAQPRSGQPAAAAAPQGGASAGNAPAPAPANVSPQQAGALAQDAGAKRAYYERVAQQFAAIGDREQAQLALDMAKQFAAQEEYFAPMAAMVGGREVLIQGSKGGGVNVLDATPTYTDTVRTQIQFGENPDAYARWLAGKNAGASRVSVTNAPANRGLSTKAELDAKRLDAMETTLSDVSRTIPNMEAAFTALSRNDTGAFSAAILPLQRLLNPDSPAVADASVAAAGVITSVLGKLKAVGGNDTEKEMERIMATEPNWQNNPEANRRLFELALTGMRQLAEDVRSAQRIFYAPETAGTLRGWEPRAITNIGGFEQRVFGDNTQQPTSRRAAYGLD